MKAAQLLRELVEAVPYGIHTVLADNGNCLSGCETSLTFSAMRHALAMSSGPAQPSGSPGTSLRRPLKRSTIPPLPFHLLTQAEPLATPLFVWGVRGLVWRYWAPSSAQARVKAGVKQLPSSVARE